MNRHPPTLLVIAARDDVIRRSSASLLYDVRSLTPDRALFDAFVRDVGVALRAAGRADLAVLTDRVVAN